MMMALRQKTTKKKNHNGNRGQARCPRCGLRTNLNTAATHLAICQALPPPANLAARFRQGEWPSVERLAKSYGVGEPFILDRLALGGLSCKELAGLRDGQTRDGDYRRTFQTCAVCEIYIVEHEQDLPLGWRWDVNGRVWGCYVRDGRELSGWLCLACAEGR